MTADDDLRERTRTKARRDATTLLKALGPITTVLIVDDQGLPGSDAFVTTFEGKPPLKRPAVSGVDSGSDTWAADVEAGWQQLDSEEKQKLHGKVDLSKARAVAAIRDAVTLAAHLLQAEVVHPADWPDRKSSIENDQTVLVVFDVNFGVGEETRGLDELRELNKSHPLVHTAVLTGEVEPDDVIAAADKMAEEFGITRAKLMLSSKAALTSAAGATDFVSMLQTTLSLEHLTTVRKIVADIVTEASQRAVDALKDGWDSRVVEDLLFRSGAAEGDWEGDTALRLLGTLLAASAREELVNNPELKQAIAEARQDVRKVNVTHRPSAVVALELGLSEAWLSAHFVNAVGLPLANGDTFIDDNGQRFVLACQPCDLVIRSEGARNDDISSVVLLPIVTSGGEAQSVYPLPAYADSPTSNPQEFWARYKPWAHVPLDILDLAWMNPDGRCRFPPSHDEPGVTVGGAARAGEVNTRWANRLAEVATLPAELDGTASALSRRLLAGTLDADCVVQVATITKGEVKFGLQRGPRLTDRYAADLLVNFCAAQSRAAFDAPLGRD